MWTENRESVKQPLGMQSSVTRPAAPAAVDRVTEQGLLKPSQPLWAPIQIVSSEPSLCQSGPGSVLITCYSPDLFTASWWSFTAEFALIGKVGFV